MGSSGVFVVGGGSEAISAVRNSPECRPPITQQGNESPRGTTMKGSPIVSHNEGMVSPKA